MKMYNFALLLLPAVAVILALQSSRIERIGPDYNLTCGLGKTVEGFEVNCPKPVLSGGWPAPHLYDEAGHSVEDQLDVDDDFRFAPFAANVAFYWLIFLALIKSLDWWFSKRRRHARIQNHSD